MNASRAAVLNLPRVAAIATMASRLATFEKMLPVIHAQVEHVFIYLDGYALAPSFLEQFDRTTLRRAEASGALHASSRFRCLQELTTPTIVAIVDDDIIYPPDYVDRLAAELQRVDGQAVVGVHGRIFVPPHRSYVHHARALHFTAGLAHSCHVHELGIGTCAFVSNHFDVDPRAWDSSDMDDIIVAIEAQRRGLPRIAVGRASSWLEAPAEGQPDGLWAKACRDDSRQSRKMRALLGLSA